MFELSVYKTVLSSTKIKRTTKQCEAQVGWALVGLDVDTKCNFAQKCKGK